MQKNGLVTNECCNDSHNIPHPMILP